MFRTAIIIAMFIPSTVFAAISALAPSTQTQGPEQNQSSRVIGTRGAGATQHLSMGPDPGGKTGATVTPATTQTGQPGADGTGASSQSGASSTAVPETARERTDQRKRASGGADTSKQ